MKLKKFSVLFATSVWLLAFLVGFAWGAIKHRLRTGDEIALDLVTLSGNMPLPGTLTSDADIDLRIDIDDDGANVFRVTGSGGSCFQVDEGGSIYMPGSLWDDGSVKVEIDTDEDANEYFEVQDGADNVTWRVDEDGGMWHMENQSAYAELFSADADTGWYWDEASTELEYHTNAAPSLTLGNQYVMVDGELHTPASSFTYQLSPWDISEGASTNEEVRDDSSVKWGADGIGYWPLSIHSEIAQGEVEIENIILYYYTNNAANYIDRFRVQARHKTGPGGTVTIVDHTDNLGQGVEAWGSHDVVDVNFQIDHATYTYYLEIDFESTVGNFYIFGITVEYHLE